MNRAKAPVPLPHHPHLPFLRGDPAARPAARRAAPPRTREVGWKRAACVWPQALVASHFPRLNSSPVEKRANVIAAAVEVVAPVASQVSITKAIAVVVGYMVIVGSMFRSLPQIIRVFKSRSGEGISIPSILTEVVAFVITTTYNVRKNYPFSTFGDMVFCQIQNAILLLAIFRFRETNNVPVILGSTASLFFFAYLLNCHAHPYQLSFLQATTIGILAFSKFLQIKENLDRGNSGELSIITCGLNVAGTIARVFTHAVLTQDILNLCASSLFFVLSAILLHQTLVTAGVYGGPGKPEKEVFNPV